MDGPKGKVKLYCPRWGKCVLGLTTAAFHHNIQYKHTKKQTKKKNHQAKTPSHHYSLFIRKKCVFLYLFKEVHLVYTQSRWEHDEQMKQTHTVWFYITYPVKTFSFVWGRLHHCVICISCHDDDIVPLKKTHLTLTVTIKRLIDG